MALAEPARRSENRKEVARFRIIGPYPSFSLGLSLEENSSSEHEFFSGREWH